MPVALKMEFIFSVVNEFAKACPNNSATFHIEMGRS